MTAYPRLLQTVLDTTDVRTLAEFYRQLFGLHYRPGDEPSAAGADDLDWLVLRNDRGGAQLAFQQVDELTPTTWPSDEVPMQLHLDCTVDDLDALEEVKERALTLGATVRLDRTDDEEEPLYVFTDPAGHPFCVFVG